MALTTIEQVAKRIEEYIVTETLHGDKSKKLMGSALSDVVGSAKESKVPVLTVGGARNYAGTYADSDTDVSYVTLTNAAVRQITYRVPRIDSMWAGLKMLTQVAVKQGKKEMVKEVDAVRFASLADAAITAGNSETTALDANNIEARMRAAQTALFEKGFDKEEITFYVNQPTADLLDGAIVWDTMNKDGEIKHIVKRYNESEVIAVPQERFYTEITLLDTTAGGYEKTASTGKDIRFIAVAIGDEIVCTKGVDFANIIPAEQNQTGYNDQFNMLFGYDLHVVGTEGTNRIFINHEA